MDYRKLKGKITEIFGSQKAFAEALGVSYTSLNHRLNGKLSWKIIEIEKACELLKIIPEEIHLYFFTPKV